MRSRAHHILTFRRVLITLIFTSALAFIGYLGYGRWWGEARARDVRTAILQGLRSAPEYRQILGSEISVGVLQSSLDMVGIDPPGNPLDDFLLDRTIARRTASHARRLQLAHGVINDGHYRLALVLRRELRVAALPEPIKLADRVCDVDYVIRKGNLRSISFKYVDWSKTLDSRARLLRALGPLPRQQLWARYSGKHLSLLDARTCDFRTAKHLERFMSKAFELDWKFLLHLLLVTPQQSRGRYLLPNHFTLWPGDGGLGLEAIRLTDQVSRVCVAATDQDAFGNPTNDKQIVVAIEQRANDEPVLREVTRMQVLEFRPQLINDVVANGYDSSVLKLLLEVVILVAAAFIIRFSLDVILKFQQIVGLRPMRPAAVSQAQENHASGLRKGQARLRAYADLSRQIRDRSR